MIVFVHYLFDLEKDLDAVFQNIENVETSLSFSNG